MKNILRKGSAIAVSIFALSAGSTSFAAESVNVAFFLEWASPNQISKLLINGLEVKISIINFH